MSREMANNSAPDEFQKHSRAFIAWLKQCGASISDSIELADLRHRHAGRGVVATEPIGEDVELFRIPRPSILMVATSQLPRAATEHLHDDPWHSLILAMVFEYQQGAASAWKPYFDLLPAHFDTPMFWSDDELQHLRGSALLAKVGKDDADRTFRERLVPAIRQHEGHFAARDLSDADLVALCHRMGSTIMAYAFDLEGAGGGEDADEEWEEDSDFDGRVWPKGMVPLADMLNADADRNNAMLYHEDDGLVMRTTAPVAAGDELFNDYGPLPRGDLLRRYGYVTDRYMPYDVVEIALASITAAATEELHLSPETVAERTDYLEAHDVLDDAYDVARVDSDAGAFPDELGILFNVLAAPQVEFEKMKRTKRVPKPVLSDEARPLVAAVLRRRSAMYPTQRPGSENCAPRRCAMAAQVIQGEKAVLEDAIRSVTATAPRGDKRLADGPDDETAHMRKAIKTSEHQAR